MPSLHAQYSVPKCSNVPIMYIAYRKNRHIFVRKCQQFFGSIIQEKSAIFSKIFKSCQIFMYFLFQIMSKTSFSILPKLLTTWLTKFYVITHSNLFISDLVYTNCTNPILWLNLNYTKLLKCDNASNFLLMNLNHKKLKVLKTLYLFQT